MELTVPEENYYTVIKHGNRLTVMNANAVQLNSISSTLFDFTIGSDIFYGTAEQNS